MDWRPVCQVESQEWHEVEIVADHEHPVKLIEVEQDLVEPRPVALAKVDILRWLVHELLLFCTVIIVVVLLL